MKKIVLLLLIIIIIVIMLPIIFTKRFKTQETAIQPDYQYDNKYETITVLHTKNDNIENIKLDEYLLGVVSAEMPASYGEEALKAQAIVARTYTIYTATSNKDKHEQADICDDSSCCQAWTSKDERMSKWNEEERENNWKKIEEAVYSTEGKIITYNGEPIKAFFHSNSGGKTEEVSNVWGGDDLPYLKSIETSGEDAYSQFSSEVIITKTELSKKMNEKYENFTIDYESPECIKIVEYTEGNRVKTIRIGNVNLSGVELRMLLGLKSANFDFKIEDENIKFTVRGYGHGVGMSQTGANSLAKQGKNYEEIIKHFYTGVEIVNI